jgi:hypothetical protein
MTKLFSHILRHTHHTNNNCNIIQFSFCTLSITIIFLYLVLKLNRNFFLKISFVLLTIANTDTLPHLSLSPTHIAQHLIITWLLTDVPCTTKRLPAISYKTHPLSQAGYNSVVAACSATVLVSKRPFKFHRGNVDVLWGSMNELVGHLCT